MSIELNAEYPLLSQVGGYLDGRFFTPEGAAFDVRNPATGEVIAGLTSCGAAETDAAIEAADRALMRGEVAQSERIGWLEAIAAAHTENREQLARIITLENGKPLAEALGEVDYAAAFYREAVLQIGALQPEVLERTPKAHRWTTHRRPAGVIGVITPWNFPLAMLAKKVAGALAAGAPMVIKPAEATPLSCIALFRMLHDVGVPPGMANLVFGDAPAIGERLCAHPAVRVISFTGSTRVGKLLSAQAAPYVKRMALELGGNAPYLVFADADLDHAADQLLPNKFRCSGQTCVCTNRVYVHASVADAFVERMRTRMAALQVGSGFDAATKIGPLIDRGGFAKVKRLVEDAISKGARVVIGGAPDVPPEDGAMFYPATLLDGVTAEMNCVREETFGPVLPIVRFETEDEAVRAANDTDYGLAAYFFTADAARCERVAAQLRFGHVGVNSGTGPTPEAPFGGMKQSGLGREGGAEGLLEFVELQTTAAPLG
ncbi:MAG: succinate-semialdehyde dehydrogenase/glutarate-semialdehyde dehydrogenase [Bradymonadia bacterium]|jgi:succinate-semialdehyde dehydrogenase/glutarate-semialdehyde dehydrogenase